MKSQNGGNLPLGQLQISEKVNQSVRPFEIVHAIRCHKRKTWGNMQDKQRKRANSLLAKIGAQVRSEFKSSTGVQFWIITSKKRDITRVLLPREY